LGIPIRPRDGGREGEAIEKWDRVTGYILLIIGAITAWSSIHLAMGKLRHPGPGFLPFGLACILIVLASALILATWKKGDPKAPFWPERTWIRPLLGLGAFVFYALAIDHIGFVITTFVFLVLWMWIIEKIGWVRILSISMAVTAVLYLIFAYFLEVPLPPGFFS
jgi:putative tricarboxylic transport membrane protein